MTARPPEPDHDALSAEERDLAARLARLDAASGPSAALDARILAAARAATPAATQTHAPRRPVRRWPGAVGAAAVLVAAVGLAWQLRPMFQLPAPIVNSEHAGDANGAGAESDTVVQVQAVPRREAPVAAAGDTAAQPAPATAARKAPPVVGGGAPRAAAPVVADRAAKTRPSSREFVDEAVPPPPPPPAPAAEARAFSGNSAAPEADAASAAAPQAAAVSPRAQRREASVTAPLPDVATDARLPTRDWLTRIRERRDTGDVAGARASLARFVIAHPRVAVPADLRPLLRDDDPWSP
ncbi:hypothetical protein [Lysobacter claricitrinus]|uniref:hypothetical protein n=1 Tax=Lysobacter claricitrinus TaxID=3367728 RepID=UPI0037DB0AF5